ncbi:hypothetical protein HUZ99_03605 [Staphylococcus sp. SS87]|nr:hypothetical protein [Staphylococcus singaporensis]HEI6416229.1 hypothetical protein [Staphylococcus aureus]
MIALIILFASNLVGWVFLAGYTAGSVSAILVYWDHQTNKLGLRDKTDWIGYKMDDNIDVIEKFADEIVEGVESSIGEATNNISNHINPMKWAW